MEHRIQSASRDESHLPMIRLESQFQKTVGGIAHQLDRPIGKPATDQADHLMRPHANRLVSFAQVYADLRGRRQYTQKGQCPALLGPGKRYDNRHHDPSQTRAAHRPFSAGESTITVMSSCADLAAPAPLQCFVNNQFHTRSSWHKGLDNEQKQLVAHC
jgi:hypothetical protein